MSHTILWPIVASHRVKSAYIFLIIGAGLFAAGLAIASISTYSVVKQVLQGSAIMNGTTIGPNETSSVIMKGIPAGQKLVLALQGNPPDVPLTARITGPDGTVLALYNYTVSGNRLTGATLTTATGDQTLEVKNTGTHSVDVTGALINIPAAQTGGSTNDQLQQYVTGAIAITAGIVLVIVGIVMMIIGAIKYFRGSRATASAAGAPK